MPPVKVNDVNVGYATGCYVLFCFMQTIYLIFMPLVVYGEDTKKKKTTTREVQDFCQVNDIYLWNILICSLIIIFVVLFCLLYMQ